MCFSAKSSISTFILGTTASIILLFTSKNPTNRHLGLFLIAVNLMQLLEYWMWIDQQCGFLNSFASKSVYPVLALQILTIFYGALIFKTTYIPKKTLQLLTLLSLIFLIYYIYFCFYNNNLRWCTKPNNNNSLQWANSDFFVDKFKLAYYGYYLIFFIVPFLFKDFQKGMKILTVGGLSFLLTRYPNWNTSNTRWCYFAATMPIFLLISDF